MKKRNSHTINMYGCRKERLWDDGDAAEVKIIVKESKEG